MNLPGYTKLILTAQNNIVRETSIATIEMVLDIDGTIPILLDLLRIPKRIACQRDNPRFLNSLSAAFRRWLRKKENRKLIQPKVSSNWRVTLHVGLLPFF